jgi:hypothetical protein|tara:strand:- start:216 stop:599 length:384 start_codon:yes stop_codon:yes gene_type:complete
MRKNDLVQFTQVVKEDIADRYRHDESDGVVGGFRSLTWEEREVWTTKHNEAVRAGHTTWYDSAGEGKLAPMTESVSFPLNGVFIVLKARTTAYRGYGKTKGLTSIACPSTGRVGFVKRHLLELVGEQ